MESRTNTLDIAQHYWDQRDFQAALDAFIRGQHLTGDSFGLATNVGELLMTLGRAREAMAVLTTASSADPSYYPLRANFMTTGLYGHGQSARHVAQRHFRWGREFPEVPPPALPSFSGKLRIAYLSANFNLNPEALCTLPLIQSHNRDCFEVFCYSSGRTTEWTEFFRTAADQ